MKQFTLLLVLLTVSLSFGSQARAQFLRGGIHQKDANTLSIRVKPVDGSLSGHVSSHIATIMWPASSSITVADIGAPQNTTEPDAAGNVIQYGMYITATSDDMGPVDYNGTTYRWVAFGANTPPASPPAFSFDEDVAYETFTVPVAGDVATVFELAPDDFLTYTTGEDFYFEDPVAGELTETGTNTPCYQHSTMLSLPVELVGFQAVRDAASVLLRWSTESETNNAGFEVERAVGDEAYARIGFVAGRGTTQQTQQYQFRDPEELPAAGVVRYRLRQIDHDGSAAYSPEVEVAVELTETYVLGSAYPNPFNPQTSFSLTVREGQPVQVAVYNLLGQQVALLHDGMLESGREHRFQFEAGALSSGIYLIRAKGRTFTATQQVTLMK